MKKVGYLIIELLIALTLAITISIGIAFLQASIACWHKEAEQYLIATLIAQKTLACLQTGAKYSSKEDFTVHVASIIVSPDIPFMLDTVTVSFRTPRGITKEVAITGGRMYET